MNKNNLKGKNRQAENCLHSQHNMHAIRQRIKTGLKTPGAGSGADSVGSRTGVGSVGSQIGAGSGADSVGSRTGAGSGAYSVDSRTGADSVG